MIVSLTFIYAIVLICYLPEVRVKSTLIYSVLSFTERWLLGKKTSKQFYHHTCTNCLRKAAYERVKKWTSKINIFEKEFLVIPINENAHWYLAFVFYPGRIIEINQREEQERSKTITIDGTDDVMADVDPKTNCCHVVICDSLGTSRGVAIKNIKQFVFIFITSLISAGIFLMRLVKE